MEGVMGVGGYVMRRANGDLFAVDVRGETLIPIWSSVEAVARYKALNPELMFFWPVKLNETIANRVIGGAGKQGESGFFLLSEDTPDADLNEGRRVALEELFPRGSKSVQSAPAHV
jgi:hypothetical protein